MAEKRESNVYLDGNKPSLTVRPDRPVTPKERSVGKLKIDVDVSDALKGLKAVTREAKKATEALKELEEQQKKMKVDWYEAGGQHVHRFEIGIAGSHQIDVSKVAKELTDHLNKAKRKNGIVY